MNALTVPCGANEVLWKVDVVGPSSRPIVSCDIQHFVLSGMSAAGVFALVRPALEAAIHEVAATTMSGPPVGRPVAVQMDFGEADPGIQLVVNDVAACMVDVDLNTAKLLAILEGVVAGLAPSA